MVEEKRNVQGRKEMIKGITDSQAPQIYRVPASKIYATACSVTEDTPHTLSLIHSQRFLS